MLVTRQLSHKVNTHDGELTILNNINLDIKNGESVAIVGASGSGKSTFLSMIAGLDAPSQGEIFIDGQEISKLNEEERAAVRQRYVAFVFQNFQLLNSLTAFENVSLPLEVKGDPQANEKAKQFLDRVGLLDRMQHLPPQLSGGEQQRVALARAFACDAPIIFADEPTGNLDTHTGNLIAELLFEMNREHGKTLILVTHSPALANQCQRILTMDAGQLSENSDKTSEKNSEHSENQKGTESA